MTAVPPTIAEPDELSLLICLARQVDGGMLREIAAADYGNDATGHFAHLRGMRDAGIVPPAEWVPLEVLELVRWSQPDQPGWKPGSEGRRGHIMRAFCCAWLLRIAGEHEKPWMSGENETVIQLLDSLERLDPGPWGEASGLLDWYRPRWSRKGGEDEDALLGVAQLYCSLRAGFPDDDRLVALCEWVAAREAAIGSSWQFDERWGLRSLHGNMKAAEWQGLGARLAALDLAGRDQALRDWVRLIGESLADE